MLPKKKMADTVFGLKPCGGIRLIRYLILSKITKNVLQASILQKVFDRYALFCGFDSFTNLTVRINCSLNSKSFGIRKHLKMIFKIF